MFHVKQRTRGKLVFHMKHFPQKENVQAKILG